MAGGTKAATKNKNMKYEDMEMNQFFKSESNQENPPNLRNPGSIL
jgi:hypothetical protein